ncbi:MAG: YIP1 family protein [Candidatus Omnitrophota bacterium]
MADFMNRMMRAVTLDPKLYEEIRKDRTAMGQAVLVVILSAIASGIGSITRGGILGIILGTVVSLFGWVFWAYLIYFIGTKLFAEPDTKTNLEEFLRSIGFSSSPGIIRVLGIIQPIASTVFLIAAVWMLVAMVVAVKQTLDYKSTGRAVAVCVISWLIQMLVLVFLWSIFFWKAHQPA